MVDLYARNRGGIHGLSVQLSNQSLHSGYDGRSPEICALLGKKKIPLYVGQKKVFMRTNISANGELYIYGHLTASGD